MKESARYAKVVEWSEEDQCYLDAQILVDWASRFAYSSPAINATPTGTISYRLLKGHRNDRHLQPPPPPTIFRSSRSRALAATHRRP